MSRVDEVRARHEAELRVMELEDALRDAKGDPDVQGVDAPDDEYRQLKADLREARRVFRELRDGYMSEEQAELLDEQDQADAVAAPSTVETTARDAREATS